MKEVTHVRKDHLIFTAAGDLWLNCKTINAAKKESRLLQKQGHVVKAEPPKKTKVTIRPRMPTGFRPRTQKQLGQIADALNRRYKHDD